MTTKYNLPSYLKGKTFAQASKLLEEKFKDRNDPASLRTKEELFARLAKYQEEMKAQMQVQQPNQLEGGGFFDMAEGAGVGDYLGAANTAMGFANDIFGKTGIDTSGQQHYEKPNVAMNTASSALSGAAAGSKIAPGIGTVVGGVIGGAAGLIKGKKMQDEANLANHNFTLGANAQQSQGDFNVTANGGLLSDPNAPKPISTNEINQSQNYLEFTDDKVVNRMFKRPQPGSSEEYPELNLGKYSSVDDYYNVAIQNGKYNVSPGKKNYKNAGDYRSDLMYLQKLNPKANVVGLNTTSNYKTQAQRRPENYAQPAGNYGTRLAVQDTEYKHGGMVNTYDGLNPYLSGYMNQGNSPIDRDILGLNANGTIPSPSIDFNTVNGKSVAGPSSPVEQGVVGKGLSKAGDFLKNNYADMLRYSPVLANALQLKNLKKPDYERLDRLGNVYKPDYVDEQSLQNIVKEQTGDARRAILESSGGNLGAARAALVGSQLQGTKALSDAYMKAEDINRGENKAAQQFGLNRDFANVQQGNLEKDINARNTGAYNTAKSGLYGQIGTDLGNIGREEKYKQMVKDSGICYDTRGAYICGSNQRLTKEQLENVGEANTNRYGGFNETSNEMFTTYLDKLLK